MKKILILVMILVCAFLGACTDSSSVGIIGGADGPTSIIVSK